MLFGSSVFSKSATIIILMQYIENLHVDEPEDHEKKQASISVNEEVDLDESMNVCFLKFSISSYMYICISYHSNVSGLHNGDCQESELEKLHEERIAGLKVTISIHMIWNDRKFFIINNKKRERTSKSLSLKSKIYIPVVVLHCL